MGDGPPEEKDFELVAASLWKLSNPAGCSCCFDIRERDQIPDSQWCQLMARWHIHKVLGNQFRVDVVYDHVASQLWTFNQWNDNDHCPVWVDGNWKPHEAGEHVEIIW